VRESERAKQAQAPARTRLDASVIFLVVAILLAVLVRVLIHVVVTESGIALRCALRRCCVPHAAAPAAAARLRGSREDAHRCA
jgi:flagellar basal body-associated protein FliL